MTHAIEPSRVAAATPDWRRMAERVKRDHAMMRALLDDIERACRALEDRRADSLVRFRQAAWSLYVSFDEHLETEEGYFAPILRSVDAWGELRVVNMITEHNEQRRIILELVEQAKADVEDVGALIAEARGLVTSFRLDMESEEHSIDEHGLVASVAPDQEAG